MGKLSFFANIREWIAGIAFDVFLWGVQMTQEEYFDTITSGLTQRAPDAANVCGECGEPFEFCAMGHYDVEKARRG